LRSDRVAETPVHALRASTCSTFLVEVENLEVGVEKRADGRFCGVENLRGMGGAHARWEPRIEQELEMSGTGANVVSGSNGNDRWADCRSVLQGLRLIARNDAKARLLEAELLRAAERLRGWRDAGCVSLVQLLEHELGLGPKLARERIRVARALAELPALAEALRAGELTYSAVRELTRVAGPQTERDWLEQARGKVLRDVERMVAGRTPGSHPNDPADPNLRPRVVRFEVTEATLARFREAQRKLEEQRGERFESDDQVLEAFAMAGLEPGAAGIERARYQIGITQCDSCKQAWQIAGGIKAPLTDAMFERAACDAVHIGSLDAISPSRAVQDIPPSVRRLVEHRDGHACQVPGCRSTSFLEIHHLRFRSAGGSHAPGNLLLMCGGHHAAVHVGTLTISGTAPDKLIFTRREYLGNPDSRVVAAERELWELPPEGAAHVERGAGEARSAAAPDTSHGVLVHGTQVAAHEEGGAEARIAAVPETSHGGPVHGTPLAAGALYVEHGADEVRSTTVPDTSHGGPLAERGRQITAATHAAISVPVEPSVEDRVPHASIPGVEAETRLALVTLGFKVSEAKQAIDAARDHAGPRPTVERLVVEALRQLAPRA
jgi:hypothetical protein